MKRAKKIILVPHCLLNVNSKVEGLATSPGTVRNVLDALLDRNYGIIQMPCPEHLIMGIKRWGQSISQYDNPFYEDHCRKIARTIIMEVKDYQKNGYSVSYVLGMNGSPSCGVTKTFIGDGGGVSNKKITFDDFKVGSGQGVFMRCLKEEALKNKTPLEFIGLDEANPEGSLKEILSVLDKNN